ncbi:MAG: hypothetical protein HY897_02740 [Deltaproteobacteria bacterium]|nr:hypothetical protein [Deltaproteobacteria bacterium]
METPGPEGLSACFATETTESTERFDMKTTTQKKIIMGQTAAVVGFAGFAVLMFLLRGEIRHALGVPPGLILMIVSASVAAGTAMIFMRYLGNGNGHPAFLATETTENTEGSVAHGQTKFVRGTPSLETSSLSAVSAPSAVASPVSEAANSVNSVSSVAENPAAVFAATSLRLRREIAALSRRGNLNLSIGVITTGFALGLLAYMIFDESTSPDSFAAALSHYVPRITTVTFIEVFAFFFLKLYRASLIEIKFYQNELTSLASLQIALETSRDCPDPDAVRTVLDRLARRNPNAHAVDPFSPTPSLPEDDRLKALGELLAKAAGVAAGARLK